MNPEAKMTKTNVAMMIRRTAICLVWLVHVGFIYPVAIIIFCVALASDFSIEKSIRLYSVEMLLEEQLQLVSRQRHNGEPACAEDGMMDTPPTAAAPSPACKLERTAGAVVAKFRHDTAERIWKLYVLVAGIFAALSLAGILHSWVLNNTDKSRQ